MASSCSVNRNDADLLLQDSKTPLTNDVSTMLLGHVYELTFVHISGEKVFWVEGYSLTSQVTFRGNIKSFNLSVGTILGKYLSGDYFNKTKKDTDEILLVKENFKPVSIQDTFGSLFDHEEEGTKCTIYIRKKDWPVRRSTIKKTKNKKDTENDADGNANLFEHLDTVLLVIEEKSGRKILWDEENQRFDSTVQLQFPRDKLPTLKIDSVLSRLVATIYFETDDNVTNMELWTEKVKVVGLKDTLDMLCLSSWKIKLFIKHIRNPEDQQWQEILDAITQFKEKVEHTDDELRHYYEQNKVFDEMERLKLKIQSDHRNEAEIHEMMLKLEPKLNQALAYISTIEQSEINSPKNSSSTISTSNLKEQKTIITEKVKTVPSSVSKCSNISSISRTTTACRSTASCNIPQTEYKFYSW